ncbi:MAG: class I SAM-dependent methyltransferase [Methanoregula sp.]|nr:class I SAM-dependent methyltransferase [Methanoregula sp.]
MLFLSEQEQREWAAYADEILRDTPPPENFDTMIPHNLVPAFHFYIATFLAAKGAGEQAFAWAKSAVLKEDDELFGLAFLLGFLQRYDNQLVKPALVFEDPRPFIHFSNVPLLANARSKFVLHCGESLPRFDHPVRFMDIGCGNGALAVAVLSHLFKIHKIPGIAEILLVDPSPAMAALAEKTLQEAFPDVPITIEICRIQDCSGRIDRKIDIAMSSLAYHHMPVEDKRIHLARLKPWIDHFLLFEMDADIDTSDRFSPALALAVYQSYGRIFDGIYAHDAPIEVVNNCIDSFLMTEVVSILTEPRGERSDYHMLKHQWTALLGEVLSPEFSLLYDSACYADEYFSLITLHYGRNG